MDKAVSSTTLIQNNRSKYKMKNEKLSRMLKYKALYLMAIPGFIYFIVFKYIPLAGVVIAFQDYNIFKGVFGSKFIGLKNFIMLFNYGDFIDILVNTLVINAYDLLFGFTAPIILAIMINEIMNTSYKKIVQQMVYLPHFLSWPVLGGIIITQLLSPETGMINMLIKSVGMEPIYFMVEEQYSRAILIISGIWRDVGWGTIIYLAAMAGINPSLYESASMDGAGKFRQMISITLPTLIPVMMVLFLLKIGHFMDFGFERVWVFLNPSNRSKIEIFDTYIYQAGLMEGRFSYTTAVGLFKSVVGFLLLFIGNKVSKKTTGESLY